MKKKYEVCYTWHSGEYFGAMEERKAIFEIEEECLTAWKYDFQQDNMDGSYYSINSIDEVKE